MTRVDRLPKFKPTARRDAARLKRRVAYAKSPRFGEWNRSILPLRAACGRDGTIELSERHAMSTAVVTDASFDADVLKSSEPVVVDFWAEWCGPCKMIAPALEEISDELAGKVKVAKLNIDENQGTAIKYGVRSIPTLILFKDGKPVATQVGAAPKNRLADWIKSAT